MTSQKHLCLLSFSDLKYDARVLRQIEWLSPLYSVSIVCRSSPPLSPSIYCIEKSKLGVLEKLLIGIQLILGKYEKAYTSLYTIPEAIRQKITDFNWDVVVANDIETLPLAATLRTKKIIFDAHEYAPRHFEDKFIWRLFFQQFNHYLCEKYIPKVDQMITVGQRIATEYEKKFGKRPLVVTNAPLYLNLAPSPVHHDRIRLIHHGGANWSRQLELMMDVVALLDDRFSLDMMLVSPPNANRKTRSYMEFLKLRAQKIGRIRILPPVAPHEIVPRINEYDLGIFLIPPVNFNYANTLPNKFFDFIQARLGVAIGPTPEMADITKKHQIGIVSDDFSAASLANRLRGLDQEQIENFKKNSNDLSRLLNAEENKKRFLGLFKEST